MHFKNLLPAHFINTYAHENVKQLSLKSYFVKLNTFFNFSMIYSKSELFWLSFRRVWNGIHCKWFYRLFFPRPVKLAIVIEYPDLATWPLKRLSSGWVRNKLAFYKIQRAYSPECNPFRWPASIPCWSFNWTTTRTDVASRWASLEVSYESRGEYRTSIY